MKQETASKKERHTQQERWREGARERSQERERETQHVARVVGPELYAFVVDHLSITVRHMLSCVSGGQERAGKCTEGYNSFLSCPPRLFLSLPPSLPPL